MATVAYLTTLYSRIIEKKGERFLILDKRFLSSISSTAKIFADKGVDLEVIFSPFPDDFVPGPDTTCVLCSDVPFSVVISDDIERNIRGDYAGIIALHSLRNTWIKDLGIPYILISENSLKVKLDLLVGTPPIKRLRMAAGLLRQDRLLKKFLESAAGVQFNGRAAADAHKKHANNSMFFNDSRVFNKDVMLAKESLENKDFSTNKPLRIGFSARWIEAKGAHLLPKFAELLEKKTVPAEVIMLGGGPLSEQINAYSADNFKVIGFLDFETEWKPYVRDHIDVMFLPHLQGDPACTYFESLGSGVPVLAFDNDSSRLIIADSDAGWVVKRDLNAAVDVVSQLSQDRSELKDKSRKAIAYMSSRTFEDVTLLRANHVLEVFGLI
ncbi:glycosyltransferase [Dermabacteraceae bacterium TAE3-ERU27]|nr:glycosyltransferase [Dermabacteraceae bacterium TAE3-ERU27]